MNLPYNHHVLSTGDLIIVTAAQIVNRPEAETAHEAGY